jgi:tetratricopeptide (TPR) repeat protein
MRVFQLAAVAAVVGLSPPLARSGEGPPHGAHHGPAQADLARATKAAHARIKALQEQCEANPKAWEPRFQLGALYLKFGLPKPALKYLEEAIALKPDSTQPYQLAGQIHLYNKEHDKAIRLWKKLLKAQPDAKGPSAWIAQAERQREEDKQLEKLDATLEKNPSDIDALLARARLRSGRSEWKEAIPDLETLLATKPEPHEVVRLAGLAYYRTGHLDKAIPLLKQAVASDAKDMECSLLLEKAQKIKTARDRLHKVEGQLRANPKDGKLYLEAAGLWAGLGRLREAAGRAAKAVELLPEDANARSQYAMALLRLGRMDEAIEQLETCVKLEPDDPNHARALDAAKRTRDMHKAMRDKRSPVPKHGASQGGDSR